MRQPSRGRRWRIARLARQNPKCANMKLPSWTSSETREVPRGLIRKPPYRRVCHRPRAYVLPTLECKQKLDSHRDALARQHLTRPLEQRGGSRRVAVPHQKEGVAGIEVRVAGEKRFGARVADPGPCRIARARENGAGRLLAAIRLGMLAQQGQQKPAVVGPCRQP